MAERDNRKPNKNYKSTNDRVIYLNRKDIRSNSRRRARTAAEGQGSSSGSQAELSRRREAQVQRRTPPRRQTGQRGQTGRSSAPANVTPIGQRRRSTVQAQPVSPRRSQRAAAPQQQRITQSSRKTAASSPRRQPPRQSRPVQGSVPGLRRAPAKKRPSRVQLFGDNRRVYLSHHLPPVILSSTEDAKGAKRDYRRSSRRGNNRGVLAVAAFLTLLFFIYICGYGINMSHNDKITYETIQIGSVDSAKKAEGVIIRSEKVFNAPSSGAVEFAVAEGDRIRSGTLVCSISNAQAVARIQENLDDINEDIMKLQQNRTDLSEHTEEVTKLENQIKALTDENSFSFISGDFSDVYNLKYSVENKLNTRNQLLLSENSASLSELVGQRNSELKQIDENTKTITADVGGVVCYTVDGTEEELTVEASSALTKEQTEQRPSSSGGIKTNVAANDPVFKVITSNEWYIASYMPDSYTEGWETGREMQLYLQNGVEASRPLDVTVTTLEHGSQEAYVVFKTADFMTDYMDFRNISFEIDKPKTGYKIPNTAICQQTLLKVPAEYVDTDSNTLVKVTEEGSKTIEITVSGTDSDDKGSYVLVPVQIGYFSPGDTIKKGDEAIKAEEVVTVDGVFLVNSGVTKFMKISMENSVSSGDYTVLDEISNPNLHIYDRVVQNVANVQENQNIYE